MEYIEVKTTFDNKKICENICEKLLDKKLIACGQILKIKSHYIWQNKRHIKNEFMLIMKSKKELFNNICSEITKLHNYEVPEIVAITFDNLSLDYAKWITENTL